MFLHPDVSVVFFSELTGL